MINSRRRTLSGHAVGHGWVEGRARCLNDCRGSVPQVHLPVDALAAEVERFDAAVAAASTTLRELIARLEQSDTFLGQGGDVLAAHLAIVEDATMRERVVGIILDAHINVAWALERVLEDIELEFSDLSDAYISARVIDLRQVVHRLQGELLGNEAVGQHIPDLGSDDIVVARDLDPGTALDILRKRPAAVVTEEGTSTCHLALLCRSMGVPGLVGVDGAVEALSDGDSVLLDLEEGLLVREPERRDVALARAHSAAQFLPHTDPELPAVTQDGERVELLANIDMVEFAATSFAEGAEGIGLLRSEFIFLAEQGKQDIDQAEIYQGLIDQTSGPVVVRTFDIGSDKLPLGAGWEPNPALGLRAVRSYRRDPSMFRAQLRALMDVDAAPGQLRIMIPMVAGLGDWRWVCDEVERVAYATGRKRGDDFLLGAMIELPSILYVVDELAREADFLSLGTNDLVQYMLGVDRQNPGLAEFARIMHPAILRAIDATVRAGRAAGVPVSCCGEMSAGPLGIILLVGLGVRSLSMPCSDLAMVRTFLRGSEASVMSGLAAKALAMTSADEVESMLSAHYDDWRRERLG